MTHSVAQLEKLKFNPASQKVCTRLHLAELNRLAQNKPFPGYWCVCEFVCLINTVCTSRRLTWAECIHSSGHRLSVCWSRIISKAVINCLLIRQQTTRQLMGQSECKLHWVLLIQFVHCIVFFLAHVGRPIKVTLASMKSLDATQRCVCGLDEKSAVPFECNHWKFADTVPCNGSSRACISPKRSLANRPQWR